jgi:cytochrome bd ubiquinol oxidase subunit I
MEVATIELSLCFVAAVSGWMLLQKRHVPMFLRALKWSVLALVIIAPVQVWLGDGLGQVVAKDQPAALAALEGHYQTYNPDGSVNSSWAALAWPNAKGDGTAWAITIPHFLSILETHSWNDPVEGLDSFTPQDRPPMLIPFYSFRVMAGAGAVLMLLAFWGLWLTFRGEMTASEIVGHKWFLRFTILCGFLPYIAVWTGWWTREIGRQPWVVYGMMTTAQGTSRMSVAQEVFWMIGYVGFELMVWGGTWYFFAKVVRSGPDMDSPVVQEGHQRLGQDEPLRRDPHGAPTYIKSI